MSRILIIIEQSENRRLLAESLSKYYEVAIADSVVQAGKAVPLLDEPFDLCILDGPALDRLWEWVQARKHKEQPVFVPFLLITVRPDVKLLTRHLWQTIDELITKPLEKLELQARVEMLLRSRRLSLQLQIALEQERELKEQKSRFVSIVSHEFRNPLNVIYGFIRLLQQRDFPKEQQYEFFQRIQAAVSRMVALLDDVLILGKSEAGSLASNPVELALEPFCRKLIEEIKFSTNTKHTIDLKCEDECFIVHMDEALLRHVLTNLLSNAIKYSAPDSTIQVRLQCKSETVIFQVQDEGIGIAPADQERLFESFYRASNVGKIPGTGLGLTIVKQAVERYGGTIALKSKINVGTTFTVTLPISSEIS
ncbi:HAMP domain-containing histidine kinase [Nostocaceae cyanobacterium CENA369]|uniref:histidine kinase n=1 Tax=Dendronalium phyllosphericum CENA369 TaxID=1725256 RepID=A0A8J7LD00_9NOST|nr:HAMP domain-containing sensor histidine kinase [Dendronalium phyllosphericum]MBH8571468.1 HAMP domain-containing histidine kinase [Dendronalium phyllosphericum CENA369]